MADEDLLLALRLQERFDREERGSEPLQGARGDPERPLSIVDQSWEVLDPNPDVRALFLEFNRRFFWGKLSGVEVKWSPRMTLCAGVCSYEGRGGLCSIRLSEPLLKLRPRKDLVETLLHEMIHALLFVTQNNRDRDGHGPEFCKHMDRINRASGTRITVYHSFHDEVDAYRQHWWRCDGPCRTRRPYYGYVKRAMNRAPSHLDPWWENHLRTCGGTYTKVKEPEGYGKKEGKKDGKKEGSKEKRKDQRGKKTPPPGSGLQDIRSVIPFSGTGFVLGGKPSPVGTPPSSVVPPLRTSPSSSGGRAPGKASVADTRAFVNVNGSPVKIPRRPGGSDRWRQKSIRELFGPTSPRHAPGESSAGTASSQAPPRFSPDKTGSKEKSSGELFRNPSSRPEARRVSSTSTGRLSPDRFRPPEAPRAPSGPSSGPWSGPWSGTSSGPWSGTSGPKLFRDSDRGPSSGTSGGASTSRKRSWNEANVSDSSGQTSFQTPPSSSSSSSSSSPPLMVCCPVCLVKVQESKINEHLDSCLS